jgi:aryl-alcohol dehydrogenase-like predicted oxidoreductase
MQYIQTGISTLQASRIGFGCMSLKKENPEAERILHRAIDLGINYFDTADLYDKGENEILIGKTLRSKRGHIILATKVGNQWRPDGSGWDWNPRKDYILRAVEESLKRLQTDHIDLYQLHGGTIDDPVDETIDAFETLVKQGKIRYYGISSIRPNVIRKWIESSNMASVMLQYSMLDRRAEESVLPLLEKNNIAVFARGSVAQGLLVNKTARPYLNYEAREVQRAADAVSSVSVERTNAQTAMQFVLQHPAVTSAVVGMRTLEQLEEAAKVFDAKSLTVDELEGLRNAIPVNTYLEHR